MNGAMEPTPASDLILYQTEDGKTRIQCRFEDKSIWLTQAQIAEPFQSTPQISPSTSDRLTTRTNWMRRQLVSLTDKFECREP